MYSSEEARENIGIISKYCYLTVKKWCIKNSRKPILDPVENFIDFGGKYAKEIKKLIEDGYLDDLLSEIEKICEMAVKDVCY